MTAKYLLVAIALFFLVSCQDNNQTNTADKVATSNEVASSTSTSGNTETHPGAAIHQEKCAGCHIIKHDAAFYQRSDRKMDSYERLQSQVRMCNSNIGLQLFDEDMTMIGEYLNDAYYKFPMN